jgi:hypothetical protein
MNITIDIREANEICRQALISHVDEMGLDNVSIEGCIERLIRKNKFLNCKRRGIVLTGTEVIEPPVDPKYLTYKDLQIHAKSIGIKADGTREVILERIGKRDADAKADGTSETEGSGNESTEVDVPSDLRESERADSPERVEEVVGV